MSAEGSGSPAAQGASHSGERSCSQVALGLCRAYRSKVAPRRWTHWSSDSGAQSFFDDLARLPDMARLKEGLVVSPSQGSFGDFMARSTAFPSGWPLLLLCNVKDSEQDPVFKHRVHL